MSVEDRYTGEVRDELGYLAAWWPGDRIQLGDFGRMRGRWFTAVGNVADRWGLDVTPTDPTSTVDVNYASEGGLSWKLQASGETKNIPNIPAASAGIQISFTRENALALITKGTMQQRIRDLYALQQAVARLAEKGEFPDGYAVVSHVVQAGGTTVLVASKSGGGLTVTGKASFGFDDLANAALELTVTSSQELAVQFVAQPGLTPVFRAFSYRKAGFGPGGIDETFGGPGAPAPSERGDVGFQWESEPPEDI